MKLRFVNFLLFQIFIDSYLFIIKNPTVSLIVKVRYVFVLWFRVISVGRVWNYIIYKSIKYANEWDDCNLWNLICRPLWHLLSETTW